MLTTVADLRDQLCIKRREARYDRIMGNPPKQWPTPNYVRMLEIRLALAELTATEVLNRIVADQLPYVYIDEVPVVRKEMRIVPHE